jgi:hypothetical protein
MMIDTIFWTLGGFSIGIYTHLYLKMFYKYKKNSNILKYVIISSTTFLGFLKGYTGNDLVSNSLLFYDYLKK